MTLPMLLVDFETRSRADLTRVGSDVYALDPSTDILCLAALDLPTGKRWLWFPDTPLPPALIAAAKSREFIAAHNARFDQLVWESVGVELYDFPILPADKWYCTSAQCRVNAVPGGLDAAAKFIFGHGLKLTDGKALIKLLSIPNADGTFNEDPEALARMGEYCLQDVIATAKVMSALRPMTVQEHHDYRVSERINDRGVVVDTELAGLAITCADAESEELAEELRELTDGAVEKVTQIARLKKWAIAQLPPEVVSMFLTKPDGKITFDKGARGALLRAVEREEVRLPETLLEVLQTVEDGNKASVAKFKRMVDMADPEDHRLRGAYLYAGASQTKRFSAKGAQVHNFRRETLTDAEIVKAKQLIPQHALHTLRDTGVMDILSQMLRPTLIPSPGCKLLVADWAAIEARVLPWLVNSPAADRVLDVFDAGEDIYLHTAEAMHIDSRQIGKVATLALGYQGGVNAFNVMGRAYGVELPERQAQDIVDRWRTANSWAVRFWAGLERAAKRAMNYPGDWQTCGMVSYLFAPELLGGTLICRLPDETLLQYPNAKIVPLTTSWGQKKPTITYAKAAIKPGAGVTKWPRAALYGGLLAENATQAVAASLLRNALSECEKHALAVVLHTHDEVICEVPEAKVVDSIGVLFDIMQTPPEWAEGLPLKATPEVKSRYGK